MIKDDELMRGDYVMFFDTHKLGKIAKVDQVLRYSCLLLYNKINSDDTWEDEIIVNYENIHPIELTPQLMERIGVEDVSHEGRLFLLDVGTVNGKRKTENVLNFVPAKRKKNTWYLGGSVKLQYVHELQHALKTLKVKRRIKL